MINLFQHFCGGQLSFKVNILQGTSLGTICPYCQYMLSIYNNGKGFSILTFNGILITLDFESYGEEMPIATLSYEALQLDQDGNIIEGAYRLKLQGNYKQHIEPIVKFIKAAIPSSDRTYDPPTYEWFYHEKWHDFVKQALTGTRFQVTYTVTKEAFTELKRKQQEYAKQAGQVLQTKQYNTDKDLELFRTLLTVTNCLNGNDYKNWTREEAISAYKKAIRFYHPDLHPERAEQASQLNEIWTRLKESYYIK